MNSQHSKSSDESFWDGLFSSSSTTDVQDDLESEEEGNQRETKERDVIVRLNENESHEDSGLPQVAPFASMPRSDDTARRKEQLDYGAFFPWPIQMDQHNDISLNHLLTSSIYSGIQHNSAYSVGEPPPIPQELLVPTISESIPGRQSTEEKKTNLSVQPATPHIQNPPDSAEPKAEMLRFGKEVIRSCLPLAMEMKHASNVGASQSGPFDNTGPNPTSPNIHDMVESQKQPSYHHGRIKAADQPETPPLLVPVASEASHNVSPAVAAARNHDQNDESDLEHPVIITPLPNDILLGRGHHAINHPGNMRLRSIVKNYREVYVSTPRREEKTAITQTVVEIAKAPFSSEGGGGDTAARFLQFHKELRGWVEVSNEIARKKVSHLLRDRVASATMQFVPMKARRGGRRGRRKKR